MSESNVPEDYTSVTGFQELVGAVDEVLEGTELRLPDHIDVLIHNVEKARDAVLKSRGLMPCGECAKIATPGGVTCFLCMEDYGHA